jgi:hypothetical protein
MSTDDCLQLSEEVCNQQIAETLHVTGYVAGSSVLIGIFHG